jgi:hypothetical protein
MNNALRFVRGFLTWLLFGSRLKSGANKLPGVVNNERAEISALPALGNTTTCSQKRHLLLGNGRFFAQTTPAAGLSLGESAFGMQDALCETRIDYEVRTVPHALWGAYGKGGIG